MSRPVFGDIVNSRGDLFVSFTSPPLAAGRLRVSCRQAVQASNYGWRWKAAQYDEAVSVLRIWIERGGPMWMVRRR